MTPNETTPNENSQDRYIELKPVVPMSALHRCVRNLLTNEYRMDKDKFEKILNERVDNYFTSGRFADHLDQKVAEALVGRYKNGPTLRQIVDKAVGEQLDKLIGASVRDLVASALKEKMR